MINEVVRVGLITFLHDLFTAVWIGGLFALTLSVLPAVRAGLGPGPQTKKLMAAIQRRHSTLVYVSIAGLLVTGLALSRLNANFLGLLATGNAYSAALAVKHVLVLVMVVMTLYRSLVLGRKPAPLTPAQEKFNVGLLLANVALGVGVLVVSGVLAGLAAAQ